MTFIRLALNILYHMPDAVSSKKTRTGIYPILVLCVLAWELPTFANTGSFACQTAEVVQFCTANDTAANDFDFSQTRGMYQESTFYAYAIGNAANGEGFADTAVLTADDDAFKNLDTFAVTFDNLYMNLDCVARAECRNVAAKLFLFKYADNIHLFFLL